MVAWWFVWFCYRVHDTSLNSELLFSVVHVLEFIKDAISCFRLIKYLEHLHSCLKIEPCSISVMGYRLVLKENVAELGIVDILDVDPLKVHHATPFCHLPPIVEGFGEIYIWNHLGYSNVLFTAHNSKEKVNWSFGISSLPVLDRLHLEHDYSSGNLTKCRTWLPYENRHHWNFWLCRSQHPLVSLVWI